MTPDQVEASAKQLAHELTADARNLAGPVTWVTGNQYVPALRSFPSAEAVYRLVDWELWDLFRETLEAELDSADVTMMSPDYDNSLFVVDLARWEFTETPNPAFDPDDINSEWKPVDTSSPA
jgi:hypothetical protein